MNPIAGIGGILGLKGSDHLSANERSGEPAAGRSPLRATEALEMLTPMKNTVDLFSGPLEMGECRARALGFQPTALGLSTPGRTTARDTRAAALEMERHDVDLLLFTGGDGTAVDILGAIDDRLTVLGVPAGVKMHSAVFAVSPRSAGTLAAMYLSGKISDTRLAEVMDVDETALRSGILSPRLHGYLNVPEAPALVQEVKRSTPERERSAQLEIARSVLDRIPEQTPLVVGPGTTTAAILRLVNVEPTLLGIDVLQGQSLLAKDVDERALLDLAARQQIYVVVTPIGGQGFLFGRGNAPISAGVLRQVDREAILVVATESKLASLAGRPLLVDTGDKEVDQNLSGFIRVITGQHRETVYPVAG